MKIRMTAIRLSGGSTHQHITHLWWVIDGSGRNGNSTRAEIVKWIEDNKSGTAYTDDGAGHVATVGVRTPAHGEKYLQTYADGVWSNNLLALPQR